MDKHRGRVLVKVPQPPFYLPNYNDFLIIYFIIAIIHSNHPMRHRKKNLPFFDESMIQVEQKPVSVTSAIAAINYREKITLMVNNETYNFFMALMTVYSIFAIDFVKSLSNQPTAYIFGYIHMVVISIFGLQMVLNGLIKQRYIFSFYFWIDVVSTISMVMEITWVDNWLADNSSLPAVLTLAKVVKASRLSRIGGRAAKILLIFITFFKNKQKEEEERKAKQAKNTESVNGESQFKTETIIDSKLKSEIDNEEEEISNTEFVQELPSKKVELNNRLQPISEQRISQRSNESQENVTDRARRTTKSKGSSTGGGGSNFLLLGRKRSKIAKLSEKNNNHLATARKTFEITNIVQRLEQTFKLQPLKRENVDPQKAMELQRRWQELIQKEQKLKNQSKQKIKSNKQNFKLGESLKEQIQKNIIILIMSLIIILPLISADTWYNNDPTIDVMMNNYIDVASSLPDDRTAYQFLKEVVASSFSLSSPIMYMQVQLANRTITYPDNFPNITQPDAALSDYMEIEKIFANGNGFRIIFNDRKTSRIGSWINIVRSGFITLLLIFSTLIFMYSIEIHALIPLESMCVSINKISINPFDALKDVNEKKQEMVKKNDIQTNILEKAIWKMTSLLVIGAGQQGSSLIESKIQDNASVGGSNMRIVEGKKIHGIFMYIKLANFEEIFEVFNENLLTYINKITAEIHQIVIKNGGIILQNDCPYFLGFWKTPQDLNIQLETTKYFTANNPLKNLGKTIETQKLIQLVLRTYLQISIALVNFNKTRMQDFPKEKDDDLFEEFILQAGIHIGDGFSGSLGSNLKIEIKCIGNDVEYAKNLCRLAGSYSLSNILSQQICDILDDHEPNYVRKVDYIKQSKSGNIGWLYTFDFSLLPLIYPEKFETKIRVKKRKTSKMKSLNRKYDRNSLYKKRNQILTRIKNEPIESVVPLNHQQKSCQKMFTYPFYNTWNQALEKYFNGEWDEAAALFECMKEYYLISHNDKLSVMMLQRVKKLKGIDVETWTKTQLVYFQ